MPPTVSVITATYNYGRYLGGAIESVLAQTFSDWEMIVVDDGSTDNTQQVIQPYLADKRIRYHRTKNQGQPAAENTGIRLSCGCFIAFLDADDLWMPEKLDAQMKLFHSKPDLAVVYSGRRIINPEGVTISTTKRPLFRGMVLDRIFRNNFVCFSSSVVRRDVFDNVGLFDEECRHASDYELWLRVALRYEFDYVDKPLVIYRTGHANLTSRGDVQLLTALRIMDRFVSEYGGRSRLDPRLVRRCYAETYLHLGQVMARKSRIAALPWYCRSLAKNPTLLETWKDCVKLMIPSMIQGLLRRAIGRSTDRPCAG